MENDQDPFAGIDISGLSLSPEPAQPAASSSSDPFAGIDLSGLDLSGQTHPVKKLSEPPSTTITPRRVPIGSNEADLQKYADMPWSDVAASGAQHLIPSAGTALAGLGHAITHPSETLEALQKLGSGAYSKAEGALGVTQDPQEKARKEQLLDALSGHYSETYGSMGGFKKALALDPFSVGMDVSIPLTLGASAVPESAGLVGRAASLAGKLGTVMDPVQASLAAAKGLGTAGGAVLRSAQGLSTGVSPNLLKVAGAAGSTADPELRAAFVKYLSGNGDSTELAMTAQRALRDIKAQKSAEYLQSRAGLASGATPLPFDLIDQSIVDARRRISAIPGTFPQANQALDEATNYVNALKSAPPSSHTLDNFDNLKQALWDLRGNYSNPSAQNALNNVYHGVRDTLVRHDPEYANLMESYSTGLNNTNDLMKTLGLGNNVAATSAIAKMLKATKTSNGQNLLDQIAETQSGKAVPYMLAGQALNAWAPGGARNLLDALLMYGSFAIHPKFALGLVAQSPRAMGELNYRLGQMQRYGGYGAPLTTKPVTYGATQLGETTGAPPAAPPENRILNTIKNQETGNHPTPYKAKNTTSSASGAYQFTDDTWNDLTKRYGIGTQYAHAADAPEVIQDAIAQRRVQEILSQNNGDISKVPLVWYTGNPEGKISASALALNKGLTPESYQKDWLRHFSTQAKTGGRINRASGGRAGFNPEARADELIRAVETAKKRENAKTKSLLNVPDEAIVRALAVAKEAI